MTAFVAAAAYVYIFAALSLFTNFVAFALIARALSPFELGVFNLFVGFSSILLIFSFDHSAGALLRFGAEEHFHNRHLGESLGTALATISVTTFVVVTLLLLSSGHFSDDVARGRGYGLLLAGSTLFWPLFQGLRVIFQANGDFQLYSLLPLVRTLWFLAGVVFVTSLVGGKTASSFLYAYVACTPIAFLLFFRKIPWSELLPLRPSLSQLRRFRPWMVTMFLGSLTTYALTWTDSLSLSTMRDTASVGLYAVPSRLFNQLTALPELLSVVLMPRLIARRASHDDAWIRQYASRVIPWLVLTCSLIAVVVACAGYLWIPSIYGHAYSGSRLPFVILVACFPFLALSRFYGPLYAAYDLVWPQLAINIGCAAANVLLNVLLIPHFGILGAAVATALAHGSQALCVTIHLTRRLQLTGAGVVILALPNAVLAALIMFADSARDLLLAVLCALAAWVVLAWRLRPQTEEDRSFVNAVNLPGPLARLANVLLRT